MTRIGKLGAVLLLAGMAAACGGNSTAVGVIVTAPGITSGSTATVIANGTLQFAATVTGASATTVYWRVCKPAATPTTQPTNCTAIPGVTATSVTPLSGYGTVTQTGLYTAPPTPPDPNAFVVMAISTISSHINDTTGTVNTEFGIANVQIDSGVRVQLFPASATIGAGQNIGFTATVTGTTVRTVNWLVNGIAGGNATVGFISSSGVYAAPATGSSAATITATATADASKSATANVTISAVATATLTSLDPTTASQGSAQQDVYLSGSSFFSNDTVFVAPPGQATAAVPTTFISTTLLRATLPANVLTAAGQDQISVVRQDGSSNAPGPLALTVNPVRPAIVASSPDSVSQTSGSSSLQLTGGFFAAAASTVSFNGGPVVPSLSSSRQLSVPIPAGGLAVPGLYPVVVQNAGISVGLPSLSAVNLAVAPVQANIPTSPTANIAVGSSPSAVAIDYASGVAVVVNTGSNNVSLVNLNTNPPSPLGGAIAVGTSPTGVAIDDLLPHHVAVVVNSADQTVSTIDLTTAALTSTVSVAIGPTAGSPAGIAPVPFSIGINSLTHRAVVAYQSFNEATILDLSSGTPTVLQQIGGDLTAPIGTGTSPGVAVDERLNWAIVTPGGGGAQTTTVIDLGHSATATDVVRTPAVVASLALSTTGVGINGETHQVLFTTPNAGNLTSFSLLDNTVNTITFMNNGVAVNELGFNAAAANPLENVGIAVNSSSSAAIVDLESGNVIRTITGLGTLPQAVAVDPVTNVALVANQGSSTVSAVSLGPALNPLQIVESSPAITFTGSTPLALTVIGSFAPTSVVRLDQLPLATTPVSASCTVAPSVCRELTAVVPAAMLAAARNYAVDVANLAATPAAVSNVTNLTVVQSIVVGNAPVGVAIDTDRDLAVVTNSGSGSVSLVALSATTPVGTSQSPAGSVGTIGSPLSVGSNPLGVAVIPRLGVALVTNNGSNNASLIDLTQTFVPQTVSPCGSTSGECTGPTAAAINQDTAQAVVTNAGILNDTAAPSSISFATIATTATAAPTLGSSSTDGNVDQNPVSTAIDPAPIPATPGVSYVGVGTSSQASSVEVINASTLTPQRVSGFASPTGMLFDPLNQVFLIANSLNNNVVILDPNTLVQTPIRVGINPTAIDYDFQTSTLVTSNLSSHTLSVLDYVCAPSTANPGCLSPRVRAVLGLGGSQQFSIAIDPKLNLAVVADQANNRILLVPLPH